jgi:hypothetical protein
MVNVIKQEVRMEESLRKRLEFICEFCRVKPIIINGNLRTIDKTNLTYLEPHRIIINDITFLAFNYSNEISFLKSKIKDIQNTLEYWKDKFEKLISFLHDKLHSWYDKDDKYIDVVNEMYDDNVLDDDDIEKLDLSKEKDDYER